MKNFKWAMVLVVLAFSSGVKCQNEQKKIIEEFEYAGAHYDGGSGITTISFKNLKGEYRQFQFSPSDKLQKEAELFTVADNLRTNKLINVSKSELMGKKYKITYSVIATVDPANPYCCYKISELSPL